MRECALKGRQIQMLAGGWVGEPHIWNIPHLSKFIWLVVVVYTRATFPDYF